uniref:Uncharacterized protein n=1 Tax=Rhizophora mucronata TaxID=61149 RepID=A0A2P2P862_RHIMU
MDCYRYNLTNFLLLISFDMHSTWHLTGYIV